MTTDDRTLHCQIITPQEEVYEGDVRSLVLPGVEGKFGVLVHHTPYLAALQIGEIKVEEPDRTLFVSCSGGFAEIEENRVRVLAETAELPEEINVERARDALERAEQRLQERHMEAIDVRRARDALERAKTRLQVAEKK